MRDSQEILQIILDCVEKSGFTAKDCLKNCGINTSFLTDWKSNKLKSPSYDKIIKLAVYFNIELNYLFLGKSADYIQPQRHSELVKYYEKLNEINKTKVLERAKTLAELSEPPKQTAQTIHKSPIKIHKPSDDNIVTYKNLPIYEEPASAGAGSWIDDNPYEMVQVPLDSVSEKAQYILRVKGDSMEPMLTDGDKIFVNNDFNVQQGDIGIFAYNEDVYVKSLGDGCLISLNDKYEPILIENDSFRTIGKVLGRVEDIRWGRDVGL